MNTNTTIPTISRGDGNIILLSWRDGQDHVRTMSYDMGDAIGSALGYLTEMVQHTYLLGVENGERELAAVQEDRERQVVEREQERDALAESLEQANAMHAELERRLSDAQAGIVTIGDAGLAEQVRKQMVELYQHGYSEGMQAECDLTGPSFDADDPRAIMYNIGRQARQGDAETGQRIEALIGQVSTFQQDNHELRRTNEELTRQVAGKDEEFDHIAMALLEEAEERGWCDDYERFVDRVNARTRSLKLIAREKQWDLYFDVDVRPDTGQLDEDEGITDYTTDRDASLTVTVQVTCREAELDDHKATWRRKLLAMATVTAVEFNDYEEA